MPITLLLGIDIIDDYGYEAFVVHCSVGDFQAADFGAQRGLTDDKNKGVRLFDGLIHLRQPVSAGWDVLPVNPGVDTFLFKRTIKLMAKAMSLREQEMKTSVMVFPQNEAAMT